MSRKVQQIIDELRGSGPAEPGEFTLDPRKAKEQLSKFLLPDPFAYVLLLVRAAVRRGCFSFDSRSVAMTFDGPAFGRDDLERLYEAPFTRTLAEGSPGLRELALGVAAAGRRRLGLVLTSASAEGDGTRLVVVAGRPDRGEPGGPSGTWIVRSRGS